MTARSVTGDAYGYRGDGLYVIGPDDFGKTRFGPQGRGLPDCHSILQQDSWHWMLLFDEEYWGDESPYAISPPHDAVEDAVADALRYQSDLERRVSESVSYSLELEGRLEQEAGGVALVVRFTGHPALATKMLLDDDDRLRFVLDHLADTFDALFEEVPS